MRASGLALGLSGGAGSRTAGRSQRSGCQSPDPSCAKFIGGGWGYPGI